MRYFRSLFLVFTLLTINSCATKYDIKTDKEDDTNFTKYKTFEIIHNDHGFELGANPINKQRIDRAVKKELEAIGYEYSNNPDLQIAWFIKLDTKLEPGIYNVYYSKWRHAQSIDVYEYKEGSLVIDVIDAKNDRVLWHAKASGRVTDDMPDIENKINGLVKQLFELYKKDTGIKKVNGYANK